MGLFGGFEWGIIFFVIFLLFGAKRIPRLARSVGEGIIEFRRARAGDKDELRLDK